MGVLSVLALDIHWERCFLSKDIPLQLLRFLGEAELIILKIMMDAVVQITFLMPYGALILSCHDNPCRTESLTQMQKGIH